MATITIFTPTYNRGYTLDKLYDSLKRQTSKDFCWLIVDDGSTDNTRELVEGWIKEDYLDIKYHWQQNDGKMNAHNYAVKICDTELFLCCDSDDYLTDDAVEKIVKAWNDYQGDRRHISGVMGPKCLFKDNVKIESSLPDDCEKPMTLKDFSSPKGKVHETFLAFRTSVIRQYPFPVQPGEKFIPEGTAYHEIDKHFKMIVLPEELMICHYLPDGYSKTGGIKRLLENPKSMAISFNMNAASLSLSKKKIVAVRDYCFCSLIGGGTVLSIISKSTTPLLAIMVLPLALYKYYKSL